MEGEKMKAHKVIYEKLFNLGNYTHEKIGIEVEIESGEKAEDVLKKAKMFVIKNSVGHEFIQEYKNNQKIVSTPDEYTGKEVKKAKDFLAKYDPEIEIPF